MTMPLVFGKFLGARYIAICAIAIANGRTPENVEITVTTIMVPRPTIVAER